VLRRVALVCLVFAALAVAATAQAPVRQLMPGVTFQQDVRFTPLGPVVVDVITAPRPGGLYSLTPALARGTVSGGLEPVTGIEVDASATATVAGINGDSFTSNGYPTGIVLQNGTMEHGAQSTRSSIGFDAAGTMHVKRVTFIGTWKGAGQRRSLNGLNQIPQAGQVVLFTSAWGPSTPTVANSAEVVLEPFPAAAPNTDLTAPVTAQATGGGTPIPADGAVLMAVNAGAGSLPPLQTDASKGQVVTVRLILPSDWATVRNAIGGGPVLVAKGKPVFHTGEDFDAAALAGRDARAGVGQLADGRVVFVAVDGNQPGFSAGMSVFDLAKTMVSLGAVTAAAVDSGASVTAAFDGQLLSRPRASRGRAVKDALLIEYAGVTAPPPSPALLSRDSVAAGDQLSYKIRRQSTVTASVTGPDGVANVLDSGSRAPGTYPFIWSRVNAEGTWHWRVTAVDDLGRASSIDQTFAFDLTLSALSVPPSTTYTAGLVARFQLSRPARVKLQIEAPGGTVVRTLPPQDEPVGAGSASWDGTLDGQTKAPLGSYVARVTATSDVGTMDLSAPFTLRG
jgi:phosphodiester glycosidase/flagellar hook capping protein FlgD